MVDVTAANFIYVEAGVFNKPYLDYHVAVLTAEIRKISFHR